jgi:hypothetical protein
MDQQQKLPSVLLWGRQCEKSEDNEVLKAALMLEPVTNFRRLGFISTSSRWR